MKLRALVPIPHADAGLPGPGVVDAGAVFVAGQAARARRLVRLHYAVPAEAPRTPAVVAVPAPYTVEVRGRGWYDVRTPAGASRRMQGRAAVADVLAREGATATIHAPGTPEHGTPFTA